MVEQNTVRSWVAEEGYETEDAEADQEELGWRFRVTYPQKSDYRIDLACFSDRETLVVFAHHEYSDVEAQKGATESQLINFRLDLREAMLGRPVRFFFTPSDAAEPVEFAGFERAIYGEAITKHAVMRALDEINRGVSLMSNHLHRLSLQVDSS